MCGIAGFVGAINPNALNAMSAAIAHRGPDGSGYKIDKETGVHFAHRRLSILDHAGGSQPMSHDNDRYIIVFNGEIYNHMELRQNLIKLGYNFLTSNSDTEVLLIGYMHWGADLLSRLNGMFAFAIHDRKKNILFMARDRFGEKPLYFYHDKNIFAFASEVSAIFRHPKTQSVIDTISLKKLFAYGYIPAPRSLYQKVFKLPAGEYLELNLRNLTYFTSRYWTFTINSDADLLARDEFDLADELRTLVMQAVARRRIGDVPISAFLSGGLDSSAVVACAVYGGEKITCYTIGFEEKSFDESLYARQVAAYLGVDLRIKTLSLDLARENIEAVLGTLDEPFADASILPTDILCAFARQSSTVALTGDGGDELFAGYDPFKAIFPASLYQKMVPSSLHHWLRNLVNFIPKSSKNMSLDFKLRRSLQGLSYPEQYWAPIWMAPLEPKDLEDLFFEPVAIDQIYSEALEVWESGQENDRYARLSTYFTRMYLQDDILMKTDRASMRYGLETRSIFLDNDVADFAANLPSSLKINNGVTKYLLKKAMEPLLPKSIIYRKKKGFGIPTSSWLQSVPIDPPMLSIPGISLEWVEKAWQEHRHGTHDHRIFLWTWLSLQYSLTPSTKGRLI